jgi:hypothetical protein
MSLSVRKSLQIHETWKRVARPPALWTCRVVAYARVAPRLGHDLKGGRFSGCDKRRIFASFVYQIERVCFLEVRKLPFPIKLIQAARKRSHPRPFHVGTAHCRSRIVPHMANFTLSRWVVSRLTFADKGGYRQVKTIS